MVARRRVLDMVLACSCTSHDKSRDFAGSVPRARPVLVINLIAGGLAIGLLLVRAKVVGLLDRALWDLARMPTSLTMVLLRHLYLGLLSRC